MQTARAHLFAATINNSRFLTVFDLYHWILRDEVQMRVSVMSEPFLRLAILLAIVFTCIALIEEAMYLAIAVFDMPLLALAPIAAVLAFLIYVGRHSAPATQRRFLASAE
jgi:hypothetical protein